jgi:hypothetical protein
VAPWLIGLAALGVTVAALLILTRGPAQTSTAGNTRHGAARGHRRRHEPVFRPASVTVAVLNGTQVYNLAHDTGQRLAGLGYREGTIATAANQTQTTTVVGYRRGRRTDALHVARTLGLRTSAVQPVDSTALQVACPPPAPCTANVIVTIGQDLANAQTTTT